MRQFLTLFVVLVFFPMSSVAQEVNVIEHQLDNGLTVLLVPKSGDPNVAAGWVAKVGSVNERDDHADQETDPRTDTQVRTDRHDRDSRACRHELLCGAVRGAGPGGS